MANPERTIGAVASDAIVLPLAEHTHNGGRSRYWRCRCLVVLARNGLQRRVARREEGTAQVHVDRIVITSYALTFARPAAAGRSTADFWVAADLPGRQAGSPRLGRRRLAHNGTELFVARALQGVFASLLSPAALSLLPYHFPSGPDGQASVVRRDRGRRAAFGLS